MLTTTRGDILTIGAVLAVYFASNGVEALRVALNRAYAVIEPRSWYWLRLELIGYTLVAAVTSLAMAFLIVLGPLVLETARRYIPFFVETNERFLFYARYGITISALVVALLILHAWLPAGRRGFLQILPGIIFTMVASLISGIVFGHYLARFANNYVTMYAGLASVIIALVFLYFLAAIFVFGGELNAAIIKSRLPHGVSLQAAQSLAPADYRLDQEGVGAGLARSLLVVAASRYPDDRNAAERRFQLANSPDRLDAVDARQYHVHQHRVEGAFRDPLGGDFAASDEFRLMTEFGEHRIEHHPAERIVLDAENAQAPPLSGAETASASELAAFGALARTRETLKVKVVPPPRRGATSMSPPIARASAFTEASPRPAPPKREAIETLACENGRNSRLISFSVRPMPLSETEKATLTLPLGPRIGLTASATPPASVNFTALSIRFSSAARRRTGSPITKAGSLSEMSICDCRPFAVARPASESPTLRASAPRSKKSCRTPSPVTPLRAASTNNVARLARCSAPALMVSTQRRSRSSRSEVASRSLMARIPVSGVRTSCANAASATSTMPGMAAVVPRLRALPAAIFELASAAAVSGAAAPCAVSATLAP